MANEATKKLVTLLDRISLPSVLPTKGSYEKLIVIEDIIKKVRLTQEEITEFSLSSKGDRLSWIIPEGKKDEFEISFTTLECSIIADALKTLNESENLTPDTKHLYTLFVL